MAATSKRALPAKVQAMKSRKRQKVAAAATDEVEISETKSSQLANVNDLQWQDVALPDRMDDYEGFFGLEEIDGVDVLRDDGTGNVRYFAPNAKKTSTSATVDDGDARDTASTEANEDWTGFETEEPALAIKSAIKETSKSTKPPPAKAKPAVKENVQVKKKALAGKGSKNLESSVSASASAFASLTDAAEEEPADVSAWRGLKLSPDMMAALSRLRFTKPTAIQQNCIPAIISGQDVIGKASTGSGKTLAFGIPLIERCLERRMQSKTDAQQCIALVLSPTRELAHQLEKHLEALCTGLSDNAPSVVCLTGGLSLQKQQRVLKYANIIVATPGRLWELVEAHKGFSAILQGIQFLVIDEADRLLSEGHFKEVKEILNVLERHDEEASTELPPEFVDENDIPKQAEQRNRQTLIFSATFDKGLQNKLLGNKKRATAEALTKDSMEQLLSKLTFHSEPQFIDADPTRQLAIGLKEGLIECGGMEKDLYLYSILLHHAKSRVMVFTNSISAVRRITPFLQNLNLPVLALHSGMPQKARLRSVERLAEASAQGRGAMLIATDVAARGLDIPNVQLVVHYHLPRTADMYVHRSGRTARAGLSGSSIIICSPEEAAGVRKLVAKVHGSRTSSGGLSAKTAAKQGYYIRTLDPDRKLVARLKPRASLAKKLADVTIAKEKAHKEDEFMQAAAEELGVDYDSEEFAKQAPGRSGRGSGRKMKEKQASGVSRAEAAGMRAELKKLLGVRINVGVSERYITSGRVDVDELLEQQEQGGKSGEFLGTSTGFSIDDE